MMCLFAENILRFLSSIDCSRISYVASGVVRSIMQQANSLYNTKTKWHP